MQYDVNVELGPKTKWMRVIRCRALTFVMGPKDAAVELIFSCIALAVSIQILLMEDAMEPGPFIKMNGAERAVRQHIQLVGAVSASAGAVASGFLTDRMGQRFVWSLSVLAQICGVLVMNGTSGETAWTIGAFFIGVSGTGLLNATLPVIRRFRSMKMLALACLFGAWKLASILVPHSFLYAQHTMEVSSEKLLVFYVGLILVPMLFIGIIMFPRSPTKTGVALSQVLRSTSKDSQFLATLAYHYLNFTRSTVFAQTHERYLVLGESNAAETLVVLSNVTEALCGIPGLLSAAVVDILGKNGLAISLWGANTCAVLMWAMCLVNKFEFKAFSILFRMYQGSYTWMSLYCYLAIANRHDYFCTIGSLSFVVPGISAFVDFRSSVILENDVIVVGFVMLLLSVTLYLPPSYLISIPAGPKPPGQQGAETHRNPIESKNQ